jgi:hypothetical protein
MIKAAALIPKVTGAVALLLLIGGSSSFAKPMMSPSLEEAVASPLIVEAEFVRIVGGGTQYFEPPIVQYRVKKVWRNVTGNNISPGARLSLSYAFHDGSACLEPTDWKYSPAMLPKLGNVQILFLRPDPNNKKAGYATYRGDFGRWDATPEKISRLETLLKSGAKEEK